MQLRLATLVSLALACDKTANWQAVVAACPKDCSSTGQVGMTACTADQQEYGTSCKTADCTGAVEATVEADATCVVQTDYAGDAAKFELETRGMYRVCGGTGRFGQEYVKGMASSGSDRWISVLMNCPKDCNQGAADGALAACTEGQEEYGVACNTTACQTALTATNKEDGDFVALQYDNPFAMVMNVTDMASKCGVVKPQAGVNVFVGFSVTFVSITTTTSTSTTTTTTTLVGEVSSSAAVGVAAVVLALFGRM
eukprot:CAMPEP_0204316846 /NCGR_PEP_ID=MMETSP0469-20131031/5628_1 /ASSEMBLY_ACC=CAM_ASM_000384 /TAXON_ID=2969 /ORGANISM="Oxyrrhis marina" /LENGTH=254 /DNA_ID=CAMNT_0051297675 /DNA_START=50 /DNA_END=814 /DNA_ORIENTATION=+